MNVQKVVIKEGTGKKSIKDKIKLYFPNRELAELFVRRYNRINMEQFPSWYHYAEYVGEVNIYNPLQFSRHSYKGDLVPMPEKWEFQYEIPN